MQTGLQRFASFWSIVMRQSRLRPNIILVAFGNKILRNAFWILLVGHIFFFRWIRFATITFFRLAPIFISSLYLNIKHTVNFWILLKFFCSYLLWVMKTIGNVLNTNVLTLATEAHEYNTRRSVGFLFSLIEWWLFHKV